MKKKQKQANLNWSVAEKAWVLRLWDDKEENWQFSKSWGVQNEGYNDLYGEPIEFVHDSVLCEIAHLQDLGYEVRVTC